MSLRAISIRPRSRRIRASVAALLLMSTVAVVTAVTSTPARADADGRGGDYVALPAPAQVLDTRTGIGAPAGVRAANVVTAFQVLGKNGVPATGVRAVLLDATIVNSTASTHLRIWPENGADTGMSFVNAPLKTTLSNTAIVPTGPTSRINVANAAGSAHIVIDIHGYFRADPGGTASGFVPLTPRRLVDTRNGTGTPAKSIAAGGSLTVTLAAGTPVPATAQSIMAEVAVVGATAAGPLLAYATGSASGASAMDYAVGSSSTNLGLKLGTTGRVTFVNKGGGAIHLVIDVGGYVLPNSPTVGAGFNPVQKRIYDTRSAGTTIAANGTLEVPIGGMAGLPTKGIAAAALNLTVVSPTATGHLKVYPTGTASPSTSFNQFAAGATRAGAAIVRLGTEGRITVHNNSAAAVNLIVDLHGWFADPRPVLPVRTFTRTSALQLSPRAGAAVGPIEYAYTDNLGSLISGRQADPTNFFGVQYTVVSNGEAFTGQPALAEQSNQCTQIIGQVANGGDIWSRTRAAADATDWPSSVPWVRLGGSLTDAPVVGKLGDGRLVQFGVDSDGRLWQLAQGTPSGAYPGWRSLGDIDLTGPPAVVPVRDGNLQLLATTATGAVRTATYFSSGMLSAWTDLGGPVTPGSLAAVVYPGFRLRVVGLSGTEVVTKAQSTTGVWAADWETLSGFSPAGAPAAVLSPQDGRTYILARGADGGIYRIAETAQASGAWGTWNRAIDAAITVATDPTAFVYSDGTGTKWAFVARDSSQTIIFFIQSTGQLAAARRLPEVRR
jgi:hypothetical protein